MRKLSTRRVAAKDIQNNDSNSSNTSMKNGFNVASEMNYNNLDNYHDLDEKEKKKNKKVFTHAQEHMKKKQIEKENKEAEKYALSHYLASTSASRNKVSFRDDASIDSQHQI